MTYVTKLETFLAQSAATTASVQTFFKAGSDVLCYYYNFSGFFGSVQNAPALNQVRGGNTVPVTFSLDGDQGLDIFAAGYPASQRIDCNTLAPTGSLEPTTSREGLSYDSVQDRYTYPWKTVTSWRDTCRQLIIRLADGTDHVAYFHFRR